MTTAHKATVMVFPNTDATDGRVRVQLNTRASVRRMDSARVMNALQEAQIDPCGVMLCDTGKYFDMIPRPAETTKGKSPKKEDPSPTKGDSAQTMKPPLEERVLAALPKIFGNLDYELIKR